MRVVNFGSLNIDHVYTVRHIVRPGETISSSGYARYCGGKGLNQSIALARAGSEVWHAGKIGHDGQFLKKRLADDGINTAYVDVVDGPSGHAVIQVDAEGENAIVIHGGSNQCISRIDAERVLTGCDASDMLLLQNEISALADILEVAAEKGMRIAFNPAPFGPEVEGYPLEHVDMFIVNETEGAGLTGMNEPQAMAREMRKRYPKAAVIVTLGASGALCLDESGLSRADADTVRAVDTTAAGDTFIGYFLSQAMRGRGMKDCLEVACRAAAICVTRPGAADSIPRFDEVAG